MDIETEKVINLVFPQGIPETWKDNPDFYYYLSKLGGYSVDELTKEPDHIQDELHSIQQSTQELVFSNYKTFIQTAENSREIFKQFNKTETKLDQLLKKIPEFEEKCQTFCNKSKEINSRRKLHSLTLKKNTELLEILEMPQLMDSCLRSNQYNEALEISQNARYLATKHGDIPIINMIVKEIENSWWIMVNQVVDTLREDLPLPRCLQLVGLLRSMDVYTEPELRLKFLHTRNTWFQLLLNGIPKDDLTLHLTKTIELTRIHLFNIITQYKALFNDDDQQAESQDSTFNIQLMLSSWVEEKVSEFLITLEQDLPAVTSIESILSQCTYFGMSFGRIGVDFTGRMAAIFVKVIGEKYEIHIRKATKKFEKEMETFTLINKLQRSSDIKTEPIIQPGNPPEQLVEFYPLAEYCNGLTTLFNELRLCTPAAVCQHFTHAINESLCAVSKAMLVFYKHEQQAFTATERDNMIRFAECMSEYLIPYIQYCIHALFPPTQISTHLGLPITQLQNKGIVHLDKQKIIEPLAILLPVKNIPAELYKAEFNSTIRSKVEISPTDASTPSAEVSTTLNDIEPLRMNENNESDEPSVTKLSDDLLNVALEETLPEQLPALNDIESVSKPI